MEETKKRIRRTQDERVAELDSKIAYHKELIHTLEQKKNNLLNPPSAPKKASMQQVRDAIKHSGLTAEEILKMIEKAGAKK